jgi:TrmH family RNA methyltransferase
VPSISSRRNPLVDAFRAAAGGRAPGLMVLEGPHLIGDARGARVPLEVVAIRRDGSARPEIAALARALRDEGIQVVEVTAAVMDAMSPVRTPIGITAIARRPQWSIEDALSGSRPLVVAGVNIQDPGNVGAMIRSAEAAGATGAIVAGVSADPFGWKALRGAMGSTMRLPVALAGDAVGALARASASGLRILAAVPHGGSDPFAIDLSAPCCLVVGGEGGGLPDPVLAGADNRITIPMAAPVESLNLAVAVAVIAYEARRQRRALEAWKA